MKGKFKALSLLSSIVMVNSLNFRPSPLVAIEIWLHKIIVSLSQLYHISLINRPRSHLIITELIIAFNLCSSSSKHDQYFTSTDDAKNLHFEVNNE